MSEHSPPKTHNTLMVYPDQAGPSTDFKALWAHYGVLLTSASLKKILKRKWSTSVIYIDSSHFSVWNQNRQNPSSKMGCIKYTLRDQTVELYENAPLLGSAAFSIYILKCSSSGIGMYCTNHFQRKGDWSSLQIWLYRLWSSILWLEV